MTERFEQEFYPDPWRRVLPLGPDGLQPYVRPAHGRNAPDFRRLGATLRRVLEEITAFGRWAAAGINKRPMLEGGAPRPRHGPRVPRAVRFARAAPRPLRRAA